MNLHLRQYRSSLLIGLTLIGLYLTSQASYLLFHSLAELYSIIVAMTIFLLTWNSQRYLDNGYLEFVGISLLFVGGLDLIHTLAYKGMGVFAFGGTNLPTQLWIAGRYLQSLSLLAAPVFLRRPLKNGWALFGFGAVFTLLLLSIFSWDIFPKSYLEGVGLTPFKRFSEYLIVLILAAALGLLRANRSHFAPDVLRWLSFSILASILGELSFSDYVNVYGLANMLGHFFKIIAFYLIYKAIIETGFIRPYDLLFRDLKTSEEQLRLKSSRDQALSLISKTIAEASLDDQAVFEEVARHTAELIGDLCLIRVISPDQQVLQTVAEYHPDPQAHTLVESLLKNAKQRLDEGFAAAVLQTGEPLYLPHLTPEQAARTIKPEYRPWVERYGISSLIAAPMRAEGRVFGILYVTRDTSGRPYTSDEVVLLQEIADRTALAITNARLYQEAQRELALRRQADEATKIYAQQLARSNRELQDFAFIASHDLQEPLRKIMAFSERLRILCSDQLNEESLDYLDRMRRAAERMQTMLHGLLEYSRLATQAKPPVLVDLDQAVQEAISVLEVLVDETGGRVEWEQLPTVQADPQQMHRLFQNLIGNALKFHKPGQPPIVKICAAPENGSEGKTVKILVEDNGIGFDEKYLQRIFQPFQRLHNHSEYPGSGMGLAICQKIVERHGGSLTACSQPGEGATFMITLPFSNNESPTTVTYTTQFSNPNP